MADNKYWNKGDGSFAEELTLDNLDEVSGGYKLEDLTDEERRTLAEMDARWKQSIDDYNHSRTTYEAHKALCKEIKDYKTMLMKKYDK